VILRNTIYRCFLAVSVTQTDYGCWTFISLGVAWENCTNVMFFCDNGTFAVMDLIVFPYLPLPCLNSLNVICCVLASLFYEACIRHHQSVWRVEAFRSGIHSTPRQRLPPLSVLCSVYELKCVCGVRGAPDSSDNLLVFVRACVWAAWWIGDILLYYLEDNPPPKMSGLPGTINWFSRII